MLESVTERVVCAEAGVSAVVPRVACRSARGVAGRIGGGLCVGGRVGGDASRGVDGAGGIGRCLRDVAGTSVIGWPAVARKRRVIDRQGRVHADVPVPRTVDRDTGVEAPVRVIEGLDRAAAQLPHASEGDPSKCDPPLHGRTIAVPIRASRSSWRRRCRGRYLRRYGHPHLPT